MTFTVEQLAAATSSPYGNAKVYHQHLLDGIISPYEPGLKRPASR